ncbi:MAG: hypothetical protein WC602_03135 [archaeon]
MGKIKQVDLKLVSDLAGLFCTQIEVCKIVGISERTLRGRADVADAYKKGQENGKVSLRRMQYRLAEKSPAMAIFLGKQYLGQHDKQDSGGEIISLAEYAELLKKNQEEGYQREQKAKAENQ